MWTLKGLLNSVNSVSAEINHKWVPSRPVNWQHRSFWQRVSEAWQVFTGKADCFIWPEGQ